jgi:hypothetical protein
MWRVVWQYSHRWIGALHVQPQGVGALKAAAAPHFSGIR